MRDIDWTPERRRTVRVDVPARTIAAGEPGDAHPFELRQVSLRGLLVEGGDALVPDASYDVTLAVDGHGPLTVRGRVVYSRTSLNLGTATGVRYLSAVALDRLPVEAARVLQAIVADLGGTALDGHPEVHDPGDRSS